MPDDDLIPQNEVEDFIYHRIDGIPHLEALLLVWRTRPRRWSLAELSERLYLNPESTQRILDDLVRDLLLAATVGPVSYHYYSRSERQDRMLAAVDEAYKHELVRITNLIHSKPPAPVRQFARAFRFTRERAPEKE